MVFITGNIKSKASDEMVLALIHHSWLTIQTSNTRRCHFLLQHELSRDDPKLINKLIQSFPRGDLNDEGFGGGVRNILSSACQGKGPVLVHPAAIPLVKELFYSQRVGDEWSLSTQLSCLHSTQTPDMAHGELFCLFSFCVYKQNIDHHMVPLHQPHVAKA